MSEQLRLATEDGLLPEQEKGQTMHYLLPSEAVALQKALMALYDLHDREIAVYRDSASSRDGGYGSGLALASINSIGCLLSHFRSLGCDSATEALKNLGIPDWQGPEFSVQK